MLRTGTVGHSSLVAGFIAIPTIVVVYTKYSHSKNSMVIGRGRILRYLLGRADNKSVGDEGSTTTDAVETIFYSILGRNVYVRSSFSWTANDVR